MKEKWVDIFNSVKWSNRFLTTILMTFLLFVVLSTATFAWYSVLNVATVGDISFTASSNNQGGGGDICLSWHPLEENEYIFSLDIAPVTASNGLYPMIPINSGEVGITTFDTYASTDCFNKASQIESIAGGYVTRVDSISTTTPHLLMDRDRSTNVFYVTNKSDVDMQVTFTYDVEAEQYKVPGTDVYMEKPIANKLRSAIFIASSDSEDYILRGLVAEDGANEEVVHYGRLEPNKNINDVESTKKTPEITFVVPAKGYVKGKIAVWFDGVRMVDSDGSDKVSFNMYFLGDAYSEE